MGEADARYQWESAGGSAPQHWNFCFFRDLLETPSSITVGVMYPGGDTPNGIPLVKVNDVKNGQIQAKPTYCVSEEVDEQYRKTRLNGSELLITLVGEPGDCVVADLSMKGWNVARALAVARLKDPSIRPWIRHVLLSAPAKHLIDARLNTTVQKTLNLKDVKQLGIPLPPKEERDSISSAVGSLDDKIELNRRMNATLEGMAQALFKSWFTDFDPVLDNAILAGNPIPDEFAERAKVRRAILDQNQNDECSVMSDELNGSSTQNSEFITHHSPQAPRPTLPDPKSLFPAAFQFTEELGWIPEGWEVGCISDLAALNPESWTAKKHPDSVNYVDLANTKDGRINETTAYEFGEAPSRARRVLKPHDTILGTVRPGNRSFAYIHEDGLTGSTGFAVLRPNEADSRSFIYLGLTRDEVIEVFAHLADGAAYPAIRPEAVGNTRIAIPGSAVLQSFEDLAAPLIAKVGQHQKESETLSSLRDTLVPKLISGELRVPQAEKLAV